MTDGADAWDITTGVGMTALVAAAGRAVDTHRDDRLVDDPYAEALVVAADLPRPLPTRPSSEARDWRGMSDLLGTRSRFFDDAALRATEGGIRQVVILSSGLDTRSHRLEWPTGTTVYEIDQPAILEFKQRVLAELGATATCRHRPLGHDLRGDWPTALTAVGFRRESATLWIVEGLLYYLTPVAQEALLTGVDLCSAPGSHCAIDDDPGFLDRMSDPAARAVGERLGIDLSTLLDAGPRAAVEPWLRARGWVVESRTLRTAAAQYHRTLDPVVERTNGPFVLSHSRKV